MNNWSPNFCSGLSASPPIIVTCSEAVDRFGRRLDELCLDAASVNFGGLASRPAGRGPHWSAEIFNKLPGYRPPRG